ncbi:sulfite exporter TauE/SafE family protein [Roseivivax sp. CAU 1761]
MTLVPLDSPEGLAAVFAALFLGGLVKGATGAGLPVVAIPVISAVYDVRVAVALMVTPNIVTNVWQIWRHRAEAVAGGFGWRFAAWGALGAAVGTVLLVRLPLSAVQLAMAALILCYIALRIARPDAAITAGQADRLVGWAGCTGGVLQGAMGISSPVSVTFLSAMRLSRGAFIHSISCYFAIMSLAQAAVQLPLGLLTPPLALLGLATLVPMLLALQLGDRIGRRVGAQVFDRTILVLLALLSIRLIWAEVAGH